MIKFLKAILTLKKPQNMSKNSTPQPNVELEKEVKKLVKALEHSTENLKSMQKQFNFPEEHYICITIKSNEKLLKSHE